MTTNMEQEKKEVKKRKKRSFSSWAGTGSNQGWAGTKNRPTRYYKKSHKAFE